MRQYPLDVFGTVTLDGSGNGTVALGPARVREAWSPQSETVSATTNVKEATCILYYGTGVGQWTQFANTVTGSTGDTCGSPGLHLPQGYKLFAVWSAGDAGAVATVHVVGTYTIGKT